MSVYLIINLGCVLISLLVILVSSVTREWHDFSDQSTVIGVSGCSLLVSLGLSVGVYAILVGKTEALHLAILLTTIDLLTAIAPVIIIVAWVYYNYKKLFKTDLVRWLLS